ncbi:site-2 protease family protein [Novosphingobium mangrovi (ex Huang et al. 2023)]|uniref:Site-2 protease family protein n=1 Tax=Novosphingobium mangrovi (ex Huang et al. 2023) TaxID=2976432 RepID=A0ABT2I2F4_9SPHN|nr:site-2 protease family protein [Novosphingobium mangrovi (ex Huang et al. 2023)]MCT2398833.1 site-2 protease family protein [Novosphingobium mangrovi (ex Huang et al. 2023)]
MNDFLLQAAAIIIPLIIAIVFHEVAHGWTARLLGDPTAHEQRRLSFNPLRHVDPFGTIILPAILWLTTHTAFGWAKPVPVNKWRLRDPRRGMMAVAAAGPAMNLVLAAIGAVLLGLLVRLAGDSAAPSLQFLADNFGNFIMINVFLAFFNLLPIPPFDGSHIVEGLLPPSAARTYAKLRPFGFALLFLVLLVLPRLFPGWGIIERVVVPPVMWLGDYYMHLARLVAGA